MGKCTSFDSKIPSCPCNQHFIGIFYPKRFDTVEWGGRQGPPCISTAAFAQSFQGRKKERTGGTTTTAAHGGGDSGNCMLNTAATAAASARRTACMRPLCSSERSSSKSCNLPEGQGPSASPDPDIFIKFCKKPYYVNGDFKSLVNMKIEIDKKK